MEFLILVAILIGVSRIAYLIGKKSAAVTDSAKLVVSISDAVNTAASEQVEQLMHELFTHYKKVIIEGTPEQADEAFGQLGVRMSHTKGLQKLANTFDSALKNINNYE